MIHPCFNNILGLSDYFSSYWNRIDKNKARKVGETMYWMHKENTQEVPIGAKSLAWALYTMNIKFWWRSSFETTNKFGPWTIVANYKINCIPQLVDYPVIREKFLNKYQIKVPPPPSQMKLFKSLVLSDRFNNLYGLKPGKFL